MCVMNVSELQNLSSSNQELLTKASLIDVCLHVWVITHRKMTIYAQCCIASVHVANMIHSYEPRESHHLLAD